jgi:hypothetical protein
MFSYISHLYTQFAARLPYQPRSNKYFQSISPFPSTPLEKHGVLMKATPFVGNCALRKLFARMKRESNSVLRVYVRGPADLLRCSVCRGMAGMGLRNGLRVLF